MMPGGIGLNAPCRVERDKASRGDVSETKTRRRDRAAAGNKGKRKKVRTRRRRGRNPVGQGHPPSAIPDDRGVATGRTLRPWNPAPKRRWRENERASCRMIFRSPFVPLASLVSPLPLKSIYLPTYSRQLDRSARRQNRASWCATQCDCNAISMRTARVAHRVACGS